MLKAVMTWDNYMKFRNIYNELPEETKRNKPLGQYFCEKFGITDFALIIMTRYYEACDWIEMNYIDPEVFYQNNYPCFELAAARLQQRYYRRFRSKVNRTKWDNTSIKDRWYRRQTCSVVRERLGKPFVEKDQ